MTEGSSTGGHAPGASLELRSITKRFGGVVACDEVSLTVRPGEIRGLLGQNGAGKSTLMKIVSGVVRPDSGEIRVGGQVADIDDPLAAAGHGIAMVHQHFSLIGPMPVWKNVTLGERGRVDRERSVDEIERISDLYGLEIDPHATVDHLTVGERQRVEIVKCLMRDPKILILDEPTSVLTLAESKALFDVLRQLIRESGRTVILISHRLEEMMEAADAITILRDGRVVDTVVSDHVTRELLAREMLGRDLSAATHDAAAIGLTHDEADLAHVESQRRLLARPRDADSAPALRLEHITCRNGDGRVLLDDVDLTLERGEILGVAGVEGNGQQTLVDLLSNLVRPDEGKVIVDGVEVHPGRGRSLARAGVGVIPADRHDSGCVLDMTVAENLTFNRLDDVSHRGVLDTAALNHEARRLVEQFDIMTASLAAPMRSLSGGNQQRVVLARELAARPHVLVAAQPTHGLDVGAMEYMWDQLRASAEARAAVLLISSELDEILALAHRIVVMNRGRFVGEMAIDDVDLERLGIMMGGRAA